MVKKILSKQQINNFVQKIAKQAKKDKMPISKAFIFGSYAKNTANKNSDLDLCFISSKFKDTFEAEVYLRTKIYFLEDFKIDIPIDVVAFKPRDFQITAPLVYEIMEHGKEIKLR